MFLVDIIHPEVCQVLNGASVRVIAKFAFNNLVRDVEVVVITQDIFQGFHLYID